MTRHSDLIGAEAVHPIAYYQSTDPGAVGAGKHWYDTSSASDIKLKVRNINDDGWDTLHGVLKSVTIGLGNGTTALIPGVAASWEMHASGTWVSWTLVAPWDASANVVLDIWKDTYANYPPQVADTITAAAKPTLSAARKATNATLTGWTTGFSAGDHFIINIDSASSCSGVALTLYYVRS